MMDIFTFYTPSHEVLLERYFLASLPDEYVPHIFELPQDCSSGNYESDGWNTTMRKKVELMIEATKQCWGRPFVFSDCDVQFFGNSSQNLLDQLGTADIAAQNDGIGKLCAGFFIAQANTNNLDLYQAMIEYMDAEQCNDQIAMNHCAKDMAYLNNSIFTIGMANQYKVWKGETDIGIPNNIIIHHANWTVGVKNKIKLMDFVRNKMQVTNTN